MENLVKTINEDSNSDNEKLRTAIDKLSHTDSNNNPRLFSQLLTNIELIYYYDIRNYTKAYIFAKEAFENDPTDVNLSNLKYCEQAMGLEPKIIVYTIMKNELDNIEPWLENIKEADGIYVLDTGSTDGSWEKINELKSQYPQLVTAQKTYETFRFDEARNDNLAMVPNEPNIICWSIDLDERFESNWYEVTKQTYLEHPYFYKLSYYYVPKHYADGTPTEKLYYDKCHRRLGAFWRLPIHELMSYGVYDNYYNQGYITYDQILVHHWQNGETNRDQYIRLLNIRIDENPFDYEAMNHLATEYSIHNPNKIKESDVRFSLLGRGIIGNANWLETMVGNTIHLINNPIVLKHFYELSIDLNPRLRTHYLRYASWLIFNKKYNEALDILQKMENANTVVQESWKEIPGAWQEYPYLLKAQAYEGLNEIEKAKEQFRLAKEQLTTESVYKGFILNKCSQYDV